MHIFIIKASRKCDLPSRNEIFMTNQFWIIEQKVAVSVHKCFALGGFRVRMLYLMIVWSLCQFIMYFFVCFSSTKLESTTTITRLTIHVPSISSLTVTILGLIDCHRFGIPASPFRLNACRRFCLAPFWHGIGQGFFNFLARHQGLWYNVSIFTVRNVKNTQKLNERELQLGLTGSTSSWHADYKDSAWIFIGGLPYDLTEGDIICIFSQ